MNTHIRIAFVCGTLGMGGAEKQFLYLLQTLKKLDFEIKVYCLTQGEYYEKMITALGFEVIWIGRHPNPIFRLIVLIKSITQFKPQLIQSTHFFTNFYAALSAPFVKAHSIGTLRSNIDFDLKGLGFIGRMLIQLPNSLIVNSENTFQKLRSSRPRQNLFLLRNVIDIQEFDLHNSPKALIAKIPFIVTTVARLTAVKRIDRFLQVISLLKKNQIPIMGWVIGDGPLKETLIDTAQTLGIFPDHVKFWGKRSDVAKLLFQSDLFLLTSTHEGLPNAIMEAMTAGLPIITTPTGDCPILVQEGVNGFVVNDNSPKLMAEKIITLINDEEIRRTMGYNSRKIIEENYGIGDLQKNIIEIYTQIMHDKKIHAHT